MTHQSASPQWLQDLARRAAESTRDRQQPPQHETLVAQETSLLSWLDQIMNPRVEVDHLLGRWIVSRGSMVLDTFSTQEAAYIHARGLAMAFGTDVDIHGLNGQIRNSNSFGHDPRSIRDTRH